MRPALSISTFRRKLLRWYRQHKRDLPWRKTSDPYAILVSEVMLQQTQVLRVLPKYAEFIEAYPTVDALANAPLADILKLWSGLGYNRRAKYLKAMAEMVKNGYQGHIPDTYDELRKLPGIGDYTANAILCFAFKKKAAAVDTNVRNVIESEFQRDPNIRMHPNDPNIVHSDNSDAHSDHSDRIKQSRRSTLQPLSHLKNILLQLMPQNNPDEFLHALMDYSAMTLERPKRKKGEAIPFEQSNRFLRGRIMKRLVDRPYDADALIAAVHRETKRTREDIAVALDGLVNESLVTLLRGCVALPATTGRQSSPVRETSG